MLNKKPIVVEKYADNGEHSHYDLIDSETGKIVWSEYSGSNLQSVKRNVTKN